MMARGIGPRRYDYVLADVMIVKVPTEIVTALSSGYTEGTVR